MDSSAFRLRPWSILSGRSRPLAANGPTDVPLRGPLSPRHNPSSLKWGGRSGLSPSAAQKNSQHMHNIGRRFGAIWGDHRTLNVQTPWKRRVYSSCRRGWPLIQIQCCPQGREGLRPSSAIHVSNGHKRPEGPKKRRSWPLDRLT